MTKYKGKIKNLKHLVASDPHYEKDVSCRYDRVFDNPIDWNVELIIEEKDYNENYEGHDLHIEGISFNMILKNSEKPLADTVHLKDVDSVEYFKAMEVKETEIGMDTAQVSFGANKLAVEINKYAKDINNTKEDTKSLFDNYRPSFAINTLTDGLFGIAREFYLKDDLLAITLDGWLDKDTEYSKDELLNYLTNNLEIEDLEIKKTKEKDLE